MNSTSTRNAIQFHGQGGEFFGIWIVNILLSVITLGIYSAWAKVRTKRYFYGNTELAGDNFEYHATPTQLLKGRLVALLVVLVWAVTNTIFPLFSALLLIAFYLSLPWLMWSNARFDAAMTSYRNVHFAFNASLSGAYTAILGRGIVSLVVLGLYGSLVFAAAFSSGMAAMLLGLFGLVVAAVLYAWMAVGMHHYFANGYQYGEWQFSAELKTGFFASVYLKASLLGAFFSAIIGGVVLGYVFGSGVLMDLVNGDLSTLENHSSLFVVPLMYALILIMSVVMTAYTTTRIRNYVFSCLRAQQASDSEQTFTFSSTMGVWSYTTLVISNFLLQVVTLGLARPWVMVRTTRYVAANTAVLGDMTQLKAWDQDSEVKSAISDELAQVFDLGMGIS